MEVQCSVPRLVNTNILNITMWDSQAIGSLEPHQKQNIKVIIDEMGLLSAKSQSLRVPITSFDRMIYGGHSLYLCTHFLSEKEGSIIVVKGMLKVGKKNLFIRRPDGNIREISPLCVLDFYVHRACQRIGFGRLIFDTMLSQEEKLAHQLGYDRPSSKLLSFLAKHYGLCKYVPQANQFVVFDAYFDNCLGTEKRNLLQGSIVPLSPFGAISGKGGSLGLSKRPTEERAMRGEQGYTKDTLRAEEEIICKGKDRLSFVASTSSSFAGRGQQLICCTQQSMKEPVRKDVNKRNDHDHNMLSSLLSSPILESPQNFSTMVAKWADMPRFRYHAQLSGKGVAAALRSDD